MALRSPASSFILTIHSISCLPPPEMTEEQLQGHIEQLDRQMKRVAEQIEKAGEGTQQALGEIVAKGLSR